MGVSVARGLDVRSGISVCLQWFRETIWALVRSGGRGSIKLLPVVGL